MTAETIGLLEERFGSAAQVIQLRDWTTWKVGGPAASVSVSTVGMLSDLLGILKEYGLPWFVIGQGSNLLASDSGCREILIRLEGDLAGFKWIESEKGWTLSCGGGIHLPSLSGAACTKGASGLAFAIGIPGTVGGAVFMNAGAYGRSVSEVLTDVDIMDSRGNQRNLKASSCGFDYRYSRFQDNPWVVVRAGMFFEKADPEILRSDARSILQLRRDKFPLDHPNAGSVFKRPQDGPPPGQLIEESGLKGRHSGGAMVSQLHANFILNTGGATSMDIAHLIDIVRSEVHAKSGISLIEEIRYIGRRDCT